MFSKISEKRMHQVRWILTVGWFILIFSLFYDPYSATLTEANHQWSPFRLNSEQCISVQGLCLEEKPYAMGAAWFWGAIIPSAIFILFVFGHELWRRICPLSFLSQLPKALGIQRKLKRVHVSSGKIRYELPKIHPDSWLGKNHLYFQFFLFYLGLCSRILFINSHRLILGLFLLLTIICAITIGYLYGGKSWCNYFCPMSPVQKIYSEPRGLFNSTAHETNSKITQSMCRTINAEQQEESGCVACQTPCIDIDAERSYWNSINQSDRKFLYYGYVGLVVGYFVYYYLYAGNWTYYLSGAWAHEENSLANLLKPGFYLFGQTIAIPKIVAVPLTLGLFTMLGYLLGRKLEKAYKAYVFRRDKLSKKFDSSKEQVQHQILTICTFLIFNFFFIFGGRAFIDLLPIKLVYSFDFLIISLSSLWFYRTWRRSFEIYNREKLATRLRKQLQKLELNTENFLEGRSLEDLNADEIYVLAKILPGFTHKKRLKAYQEILRDSLEEGYVNASNCLERLQKIRQELEIHEKEHLFILKDLAEENLALLYPKQQELLTYFNDYY